ncbi:MAG: ParA family protein [Chloroflexota bacterium]
MRAKIIAVTNRKGGVGKSTMSSHIAAGLAHKGYNIGLIDTDSQGHGGMMVGMRPADSLFDLLIQKKSLEDVVRLVPRENYTTNDESGTLLLIPSAERTYQIPYMLQQDESFLFLEKMEEFAERGKLDYIIIDTNPSLSLFDGSIYLAADAFVYVTECETMSMQGVRKAFEQMKRFGAQRQKYLNRESRILGILPNKFRNKTLIHQRNVDALRDTFGDLVWEPVTLRTIWTEASNFFQPVFMIAPESNAAADAMRIVNSTERSLKQWQNQPENNA